jgi:uncharacterized membrane protein
MSRAYIVAVEGLATISHGDPVAGSAARAKDLTCGEKTNVEIRITTSVANALTVRLGIFVNIPSSSAFGSPGKHAAHYSIDLPDCQIDKTGGWY